MKDYETGWLNFEDYLYTWHRSEISKKDAIKLIESKIGETK